jgi:hypothetical protein
LENNYRQLAPTSKDLCCESQYFLSPASTSASATSSSGSAGSTDVSILLPFAKGSDGLGASVVSADPTSTVYRLICTDEYPAPKSITNCALDYLLDAGNLLTLTEGPSTIHATFEGTAQPTTISSKAEFLSVDNTMDCKMTSSGTSTSGECVFVNGYAIGLGNTEMTTRSMTKTFTDDKFLVPTKIVVTAGQERLASASSEAAATSSGSGDQSASSSSPSQPAAATALDVRLGCMGALMATAIFAIMLI